MAMMTNEEIITRAECDLVRQGLLDIDEGGIEPIHTFETWKALGYSVMKGQHAICKISIWKQGKKKAKGGESEIGRAHV